MPLPVVTVKNINQNVLIVISTSPVLGVHEMNYAVPIFSDSRIVGMSHNSLPGLPAVVPKRLKEELGEIMSKVN